MGILVMFLISKGKLSAFPIEDDIRCGFFIDRFYEVEECSLYPYTLKHFNQEWILYLVKCFSASIERMWRKGNPLTLLVGMQVGALTLENSVEIP